MYCSSTGRQILFALMAQAATLTGTEVVAALSAVHDRAKKNKEALPSGGRDQFLMDELANWKDKPQAEQLVLGESFKYNPTRSSLIHGTRSAMDFLVLAPDLSLPITEVFKASYESFAQKKAMMKRLHKEIGHVGFPIDDKDDDNDE